MPVAIVTAYAGLVKGGIIKKKGEANIALLFLSVGVLLRAEVSLVIVLHAGANDFHRL
jgi:hypothetical protein